MAKKKKPKPTKVFEDEAPRPKLRRLREEVEDDGAELTTPKARNDIFTGLAALSLLALIGAAVFFYQDYEETNLKSLAAPVLTVPTAAVIGEAKGKIN